MLRFPMGRVPLKINRSGSDTWPRFNASRVYFTLSLLSYLFSIQSTIEFVNKEKK